MLFLRCSQILRQTGRVDICYAGSVAGRPVMNDQTDSAVKEREKLQHPTLYKVVLLNDDYTTMEFVIRVLETVFQKSPAEAFRIMMQVHQNGSGLAGVYPWEVAETKVETVTSLAREAEYPLRAAIEEA
jgi:ATP-dependent Clp protease adaptor protein ClpS